LSYTAFGPHSERGFDMSILIDMAEQFAQERTDKDIRGIAVKTDGLFDLANNLIELSVMVAQSLVLLEDYIAQDKKDKLLELTGRMKSGIVSTLSQSISASVDFLTEEEVKKYTADDQLDKLNKVLHKSKTAGTC